MMMFIMRSIVFRHLSNISKERLCSVQNTYMKIAQLTSMYSTDTKTQADDHDIPVMTLYTKENCQLCEEAKIQLVPLSHRFKLEEVDITLPENKEWFNKYRYDIPVFHFNGKFLMKHRVDIKLCEKTLTDFEMKVKQMPR